MLLQCVRRHAECVWGLQPWLEGLTVAVAQRRNHNELVSACWVAMN